jgi:hypothetical protein
MIDPGLCGNCLHGRTTGNRRGSTFFLCRLAESDARFPRYPALPVIRCPGHEPRPVLDHTTPQRRSHE